MLHKREGLDKPVDCETLETTLIKAAEKIGLKERKEKDVFEENGCIRTTFYFRGPLFPSMEVVTYNHGNAVDFFSIYASGIRSKKTVEDYVKRVHDYL